MPPASAAHRRWSACSGGEYAALSMSCAPASSLGAVPANSREPRGRHTGMDHRATGEGAQAMSRRAKIVCTLGPATSGPGMATRLVAAGLDVARLNMSHGDHDAHRAAYQAVRAASDASGRSVGVLVDLQGPKIRLGRFAAGPVTLAVGQEFTIPGQDVPGDETEASTTYTELAGDVRPGTQILVDDGRVVLEVTG